MKAIKSTLMAVLYLAMMFVSLSSYRVVSLCLERSGIYFIGVIFGFVGICLVFFAPSLLMYIMGKWKMGYSRQVLSFVLSLLLIIAFVLYVIFFNLNLMRGRDVTLEVCIVIGYIVMAVIGLVKSWKEWQ